MATDYGYANITPTPGLLGFGGQGGQGLQVPMLSQAQMGGLLGSFQGPQAGQFGQRLNAYSAADYIRDNPDVAAEAQKLGRDPNEFASFHYNTYGRNEGRKGFENISSQFDPYAVLRANPQLANNPNFSWLNGLNLSPMKMTGWAGLLDPRNYPGPAAPPGMADQVKDQFKNNTIVGQATNAISRGLRSLF